MLAKSSYYASDGAAYEMFLGRWTKRLAKAVLDFAEFSSDGALLDVGTGTGSMAFAMAARWPGRSIIGVDMAHPYVAYAKSQAIHSRPSFEIGDAAKLPYDDGSFTGVAAQLVLNFVTKPDRALAEMIRVTRAGGIIVGAVWDFRGGLVFSDYSGIRQQASIRGPARRVTAFSPHRSHFPMVCRRSSKQPAWLGSGGARSPFAWTMPALRTIGDRSWAGRAP
jgi:SAM-dependent methyltransferase